jgi:hypothetical protein
MQPPSLLGPRNQVPAFLKIPPAKPVSELSLTQHLKPPESLLIVEAAARLDSP